MEVFHIIEAVFANGPPSRSLRRKPSGRPVSCWRKEMSDASSRREQGKLCGVLTDRDIAVRVGGVSSNRIRCNSHP
jgi:hypothetical protein